MNGIIGADTSVGVVTTDVTWKCTGEYTDGWSDCDFDDSNWPNAVDTPNTVLTQYFAMMPVETQDLWRKYQLTSSAYWIWDNITGNSDIVYCRKRLQPGRLT